MGLCSPPRLVGMLNCAALAGDGASRRDPRPTVAIAAWPLLTAEQRASTAQIPWGERARLVKGRSSVSQYSFADVQWKTISAESAIALRTHGAQVLVVVQFGFGKPLPPAIMVRDHVAAL